MDKFYKRWKSCTGEMVMAWDEVFIAEGNFVSEAKNTSS